MLEQFGSQGNVVTFGESLVSAFGIIAVNSSRSWIMASFRGRKNKKPVRKPIIKPKITDIDCASSILLGLLLLLLDHVNDYGRAVIPKVCIGTHQRVTTQVLVGGNTDKLIAGMENMLSLIGIAIKTILWSLFYIFFHVSSFLKISRSHLEWSIPDYFPHIGTLHIRYKC